MLEANKFFCKFAFAFYLDKSILIRRRSAQFSVKENIRIFERI